MPEPLVGPVPEAGAEHDRLDREVGVTRGVCGGERDLGAGELPGADAVARAEGVVGRANRRCRVRRERLVLDHEHPGCSERHLVAVPVGAGEMPIGTARAGRRSARSSRSSGSSRRTPSSDRDPACAASSASGCGTADHGCCWRRRTCRRGRGSLTCSRTTRNEICREVATICPSTSSNSRSVTVVEHHRLVPEREQEALFHDLDVMVPRERRQVLPFAEIGDLAEFWLQGPRCQRRNPGSLPRADSHSLLAVATCGPALSPGRRNCWSR